jgi:transposase
METTNLREVRGLQLANRAAIKQQDGFWIVPSESGTRRYKVDLENGTCLCLDFMFKQIPCKHIYAARFRANENKSRAEQIAETPVVWPKARRKSYTQNWSAYHSAQVNEKPQFQKLLASLCSGIEEPEQTTGRPRLPLADMVFACIFKSYSTFSGRRFSADLQNAHALGHISRLPHYNSVFRSFENPELTPILEALVIESSKPLSALETSFAIDATALAITHGFTWNYAKHEQPKMIAKREWKKVHAVVGVKTNAIFAAKVTPNSEHEMNHFASLLETVTENNDVQEILADSGYLSKANLQKAIDKNVFPYIAWKSNNSEQSGRGNETWNKLFHWFAMNRETFVKRYSLRSNVETCFSMLKMKFGGTLRSKTSVAQTNEALTRCIAHNLCCLVQSFFEFGIVPEFFASEVLNGASKPEVENGF